MPSKDLTFRLFGEDSTASASLRRLSQQAERTSSQMSGTFSKTNSAIAGAVGGIVGSLTSMATGAIGGVIGQVANTAKSAVIDFNSTLENATIGFTTMLGSGKQAQDFLGQLQDFAKSTPFEFQNLVSNAQQMMGMGIAAKDVIPDLTALGDSVASMGGNSAQVDQVTLAFSQMAAKGTLDMGNMNQLLQGGLPSALKVLASSYGVTTGKMISMISAGDVQAKDALPRLVKGIEQGTKSTAALGGMMDKQSGTMQGALSNIQDALTQTLAGAGKPFFKLFESGAKTLASFVGSKGFQKWGADTAKAIQGVVTHFKPFTDGLKNLLSGKGLPKSLNLGGLGKSAQDLGKAARDTFDKLKDAAKKALPNLQQFAHDVLPKILDLLKDIVPLLGDFGRFLKDISPVLIPLGKAFGWVVDHGLNPMIQAIKNALDIIHNFGDPKQIAMDGLKGKFGDLFQTVSGALYGMSQALVAGVGAFQHGFEQIAGFISGLVGNFQHGGQQIIDFFAGIPGAMTTIGVNMVNGLIGGLQGAWGALVGTLHGLAMSLPEPVRNALGIHSPSRVFHEIGRNVGQGLHNGLLGTKDQIQAASNKLADAVVSMFKSKDISKSSETRALDVIHSGTKRLEELAKKRAIVATRLKAAQDTLKQALSDRKDYAAGVKSSTVAAGDVTTLGSAGDMVQRLHDLVAHTKTFRSIMGQLAKKGIDRVTYDELAQAGVAGGGLEAAQSLLANPLDFKQVVSLQKQLNAAAGSLGSDTSAHQYARTLATDRGRVSDLQHLDTAYARQQRTAARALVRNAERDVHVTVNLSGHVYGSKTELAKAVTDAIRAATRSGAISKNALKV